jgi:NAD(P)-dependent dehydrogenase (short-subunit alcohol dehydrogenase family)
MNDNSREFAGRTVLVTGATKGIGRTTAELLVLRGASVLALGRSADDLAPLKAKIGCRTIVVDLADLEATRAAVRANLPFDLLVNCAGTTALQPFLDLTLETFDRIMTVNAKAAIVVAQEYARDRIAAKRPGSIVNVSSDASFLGVIDHTAYCA